MKPPRPLSRKRSSERSISCREVRPFCPSGQILSRDNKYLPANVRLAENPRRFPLTPCRTPPANDISTLEPAIQRRKTELRRPRRRIDCSGQRRRSDVKAFSAAGSRPAVLFEQHARLPRRQRPDEDLWPAGLRLRATRSCQRQNLPATPCLFC